MSSARIERERAFHNKRFGENSRKSADVFMAVVHESRRCYESFLLEQCRDRTVLEYGCGPGSSSFFLARHGARVVGIDISDVAIEQASLEARRENLDITYRVMNAEALTFPAGTFDLVCGVAILHHLDLDRAFAQIVRTLKPGGAAVFFEPLGHNPAINLYRRLTPKMRTPDEHPLLMADLAIARKYFRQVETHFFTLQSLLATPFRKTRLFRPLLHRLERFDTLLFNNIPFMRRYAWQVVMRLSQPIQG